MSVGNQHLFWWACGILVANWSLAGNPVFLLLGRCLFGGHLTSWWAINLYLVGTWCFGSYLESWRASGISFGEYVTFWWPPGMFMGTQRFFW